MIIEAPFCEQHRGWENCMKQLLMKIDSPLVEHLWYKVGCCLYNYFVGAHSTPHIYIFYTMGHSLYI